MTDWFFAPIVAPRCTNLARLGRVSIKSSDTDVRSVAERLSSILMTSRVRISKTDKPLVCPKGKSLYWDRDKKEK